MEGQDIVSDTSPELKTPKRKYKSASSTKGKNRTPSGQPINYSVKDIRNFFSQSSNEQMGKIPSVTKRSNSQSTVIVSKDHDRDSDRDYDQEWKVVTRGVKRKSAKRKSINTAPSAIVQSKQKDQLYSKEYIDQSEQPVNVLASECLNSPPKVRSAEQTMLSGVNRRELNKAIDYFKEGGDEEDLSDLLKLINSHHQETQGSAKNNRKNEETEMADIKEVETEATPSTLEIGLSEEVVAGSQTMDVSIVLQMFRELKDELQSLKQENVNKNKTAKDLYKGQSVVAQELIKLKKEVSDCKRENKILAGIVQTLGNLHIETEKRIDRMEQNSMKLSVIISGLQTSNKIKDYVREVKGFIINDLAADVDITDCFKLGIGNYKPVIITVSSMSQKLNIFQKLNEYKKANEDIEVYISDFLPAEVKERKRRERELYRENESEEANKLEMAYGKGGLMIQGEMYKAKVNAPLPTKILKYEPQKVEEILKMKIPCGETFEMLGSTFLAHVWEANNFEQINDAYMNLRMKYPQAKHITCAYRIAGMPRCYHEDYCDDKESGGGNYLLKLMKTNSISSTAVFVVRHHKGPKLGNARFELMYKAVESAVKEHPYNKYVNANQSIEPLQQQFDKGTRIRGRAGTKYQGRNYPSNIRGTSRTWTNSARGTNKRRKHNSGENFSFDQGQFSQPSFVFSAPMRAGDEESLGSSWPSLQQAALRGK